jgi:periplasmic divalent cation tolerance protein
MMEETMIVLTTTGTLDDGERLANAFVEEHLAACVNLIPISSVYPWEDAIQHDQEVLLVIKTASRKLHRLEERLHQIHPYSVPEFVAVEAGHVADAYKAWLLNWLA